MTADAASVRARPQASEAVRSGPGHGRERWKDAGVDRREKELR
jgi:hypothetical protein